MGFQVIVTIGPSIFNKEKLKAIDKLGKCIYRINGVHIKDEEYICEIADFVRKALPKAQLMIDLPGNKIRTKDLSIPIKFEEGEVFELHKDNVNYDDFFKLLKVGHKIYANDSIYKFEVKAVNKEKIKLLALRSGILANNKGLHVRGIHKDVPFLFEKDKKILVKAIKAKINFIALSYVRNTNDIELASKLINKIGHSDVELIAKIETLSAINNLPSILKKVNYALLDRGDLCCDIGLMNLPEAQHMIINKVKARKKKIFLATQFLKNMQESPVSSIAEAIDLYNTIKMGINAIQLSEETAIGKYPVECVRHVYEVYNNLLKYQLRRSS